MVLDIGCGYNLYKEKLGDRLWGIDVVNKKADQVISWEDYKPHMDFTVYFILGAFNWGSEEQIEAQVSKKAQEYIGGRVPEREGTFQWVKMFTHGHWKKISSGVTSTDSKCWSPQTMVRGGYTVNG